MQQWGLRSANYIVLNRVCVYQERVYADNVVTNLWLLRSYSFQHHSEILANISSEEVSQVRTKERKSISFICKVNLNFLRSSRHFNCDTALPVIVSFLNDSFHGLNDIVNVRVKTGFWIRNFLSNLIVFCQKTSIFPL